MLKVFISLILILFAFLNCPRRAQGLRDADQLTDLFEGAVQSVRSFDLRITATRRVLLPAEVGKSYIDEKGVPRRGEVRIRRLRPGENPPTQIEFSRQIFQQGKGRIEILDGPDGKPIRVATYDRELGKAHHTRAGEVTISRTIRTITVDGGDYRAAYRSVVGGITLDDLVRCLRQRKGNVVVKDPSVGASLVMLEASPVPRERLSEVDWGEWGFRVALDPRRGMMPALIEVLQPLDGKLALYRRMSVNEWKEIRKGTWVPIKVTTHVFYLSPSEREFHGEIATETTLVVDLARSSWNNEVGEGLLQLPLPAGTKVADLERGVRYVMGKPDPGKNLEQLAKDARNLVPISSSPPRERNWLTWVIYGTVGGGIVAVLTLAGTLLWKRRLGQSS